ncbi:MAG: hypothetical protein KDA41_22600, partial [Planctomycetales bacterium]|nr:hypothetical protein [Planctomycetales bacterium]
MLVDISAAPAADAIPVLSGKDRLQQAVEDVLRAAARPNYVPELRRHPRTPYPYVFHIAPVAADGQTPVGEAFAVIGKHLSPHGVDFYHQSPVPYRRALAWFDGSGG